MTYRELQKKYSSLSLRERILICLVGVALFAFPGYFTFIDRYDSNTKRYQNTISSQEEELARVEQELAEWQAKLTENPNDVLKKQKEDYEKQMNELNSKLNAGTMNLIDAGQMPEILADVLSPNGRVVVKKMESIKPKLLFHKDDIKLYQHGMKITLEGQYLDIMRYLEDLEQMKTNFYWKSLNYQVQKYPLADVVLELYTLSINKDFIKG